MSIQIRFDGCLYKLDSAVECDWSSLSTSPLPIVSPPTTRKRCQCSAFEPTWTNEVGIQSTLSARNVLRIAVHSSDTPSTLLLTESKVCDKPVTNISGVSLRMTFISCPGTLTLELRRRHKSCRCCWSQIV